MITYIDGVHTASCDECGREFTLERKTTDEAPFRSTERETLIVGLFAYGWLASGDDTLCPMHVWLMSQGFGSHTTPAPEFPNDATVKEYQS